jgi:TIR domain
VVSNVFTGESSYDVFLSYNSADHGVVEDVARKLRDANLKPFLDRWHLAPGMRWRSKLEDTLSSCKAVAIFVGSGEMGSWQQREVDVALDLQVEIEISPSYRYYSRTASHRWAFFDNSPGWTCEARRSRAEF